MPRSSVPLTNLFSRAVTKVAVHSPVGPEVVQVYEAALRVLTDRGTRAATMDDIAARSGVSRATLFRRFGGRDALFEAAVAHTLGDFLGEITTTFRSIPDPTERIAEAFVACLRLRRRLLSGTADTARNAELLTMLSTGSPAPMEIGRRFIAARIRVAQSEGTLPPGDPDLQADAIIHMTAGYLLLPSPGYDLDDDEVARDLARRVIAPIITRPAPSA
ncbi:TetR/AcrR family transcriptional regulator [Nocardia flavorosea]|uniref:TetR/AcrR family transcriptional regulator n=1 Tax=Nocardia flavorosea TaxID=53429 RepID=A0A846YAL7_9NOCA|nr:TetR/AcrR family transcriptional regulator [Nocardia flavorosea]NKY54852.1 TetR/AcrR family transcriptional regulator [Nocardia flavorosea]